MRGGAAGRTCGSHWYAGGVDGAALRIDDRLPCRIHGGGLSTGTRGERIFGHRAAKRLLKARKRSHLLGGPDE